MLNKLFLKEANNFRKFIDDYLNFGCLSMFSEFSKRYIAIGKKRKSYLK